MIQTDTSHAGLGSVLLQRIGGEERVISYASRKLLPRECNYSTIEREIMSIIWSLQKLQDYIDARHVVVETDHRPWAYLKTLAQKKFEGSQMSINFTKVQRFNYLEKWCVAYKL